MITTIIIFGTIVGIIFIFLYYKKLQDKEINYEKENAIKICKKFKPIIKRQYLCFEGKNEYERKNIGKVLGYFEDEGNIYLTFKQDKEINVFKGSREDFHNIVGEDNQLDYSQVLIKLKGMIFTPELNGFLFLGKDENYKDVEDYAKKKMGKDEELYRYDFEETQDDFVRITQKSIDTSPNHQKVLERNNMFQDSDNMNSFGVDSFDAE